jgi:eukaryotic-like serine/threonine-protein kinase
VLTKTASPRLTLHASAVAGCGACAETWKVRDRRTGRYFARKQLLPDWRGRPIGLNLFENEAEVGAAVSSEYIVPFRGAHLDADPPFLLFDWLEGGSLEEHLHHQGCLPWGDAVWVARQCAQGMHDLLNHGYIHGDIKPANVMLCDDGSVRLIDLGFARRDEAGAACDLTATDSPLLAGTPEYMAPESLVASRPPSIARDIYSLGVMLYRMLTGRLPFQGEHAADILRLQREHIPQTIRALAPHAPPEAVALVQQLLSKQPLRRGGGLHWLIRELIGLELKALHEEN